MRKIALAAALLAVLLVPSAHATSTATTQTAGAFLVETTWQNIRGQYGRIWPKIHPRQRAVTTRERWEACQRKQAREAADWEFLTVRASDSYPDTLRLPPLGRVYVTAVTLRARARHTTIGTRTITDTAYVMRVGGRWKGVWTPEDYRAYRAGRCPAS